jgi:3-dehydroquinate dehydratase-2
MKLLIVNGPNLNMVGHRAGNIYGTTTFDEFLPKLKQKFPQVEIELFQSNVEGELINVIQVAPQSYDAVIINAGGYTHTSVALGDAVADAAARGLYMIEVHISSILAREDFRHLSFIAPHVKGSIMGFGLESYTLAVYACLNENYG